MYLHQVNQSLKDNKQKNLMQTYKKHQSYNKINLLLNSKMKFKQKVKYQLNI